MNIIKPLIYFYLISLSSIEWNITYCMEEKENSYDIGARYYEGRGVEPDKVEAVKWFRRAAEEDEHVTAQFRLAICYELGDGVNQDKAEFAKWLQKAAEQGHIIAQFRTGVCYEKGEGVNQDKAEALKWFQKSADQGNLPAQKRVIQLKSELFGHSSTADQLNSTHKPNANISKTQASTTNKNVADKGNSINNTNPISFQNQRKPLRQNNQKQNDQKTLSPEELKKAEEAARKAMDELIAEEEVELRKRKQTARGNSRKVKGKGNEGIKKEEKKEPVSTKQITSVKKATEKPSGNKSDQVSSKKISAVEKVPTITPSSQTQKQDNASKDKQKGQGSNTSQTTHVVNNNPILASPDTQKEVTNTVGKEGKKKEKGTKEPVQTTQVMELKKPTEKSSDDKLDQVSNTKISIVDKVPTITPSPQTQKQGNAPKSKQKGHFGNTVQATQAVNDTHILTTPEAQKEVTNIVGKEGKKKKEGAREPAQIAQVTDLKKATERPLGGKLYQASNTKVPVVDKVPTITRFSQTQKQANVSQHKQDGQWGNTGQTTKAIYNNHILASPETQSEATTVEKEGGNREKEKGGTAPTKQITSVKKATEEPSGDKPDKDFNTNISVVDKVSAVVHSPEAKKQDNVLQHKQVVQLSNTAHTTQTVNHNRILTYPEKQSKPISNVWKKKAISINSTADTINDGEKNAVIDTNQLLQTDNQHKSINDHQPKPHKQKNPKALWSDVKGMLKKKKPENKDETRNEVKAESNIVPMSSPIFYPTIAYPTEHKNGGAGIPYFSGQIRYLQVPVPFPVPIKIPVYIPMLSSFPHVSGNMSQPWVPHTQIKYEDGKKIVTQWNDDGKGSTHVYYPDSDNVELEYSYLDTRLRHLKSILKTHGSQVDDEDEDNITDSTSSHIIHHGGDAAKQKNEEFKKKICYLEKLIQEKSLGFPK